MQDHPKRFGAFAVLPLPDVDAAYILFGSDLPFAPEPVTQASVQGLASYDGFDDAARRLIERDNALTLLPSLRRIA